MQSGYDIGHLVQEAQTRWLKPPEVLFILQNHESHQITQEPPQKPPSGSLFLFNKRVLRFFRKDGHSWRKKKDGRTVGEAHERLKVGNVEALNCYYAHGEKNPSFQRRSYWMLDPAYDHIVLVHYREITDAKLSFGSISELSPGPSSTFSQSPTSCILQNPGSTSLSDVQDPYQNLSSPGSTEVSSEVVIKDNRILHYDRVERTGNLSTSSHIEVSQALRRLEEQLSLDDDTLKDYEPIYHQDENEDGHVGLYDNNEVLENDQSANLQHNHFYRGHTEILSGSSNHALQPHSGDNGMQPLSQDYGVENKESLSWNDALGLTNGSFSEQRFVTNRNDKQLASSTGSTRELENQQLWDSGENKTGKSYMLSPQEAEIFSVPFYSFATSSCNTKQDYYSVLLDRSQFGMPFEVDSSLTIPQEQKFTIREISPEWGFANEATKVIIIGSFLCDPSDCTWTCMFGDIEVPMQMIQDGVLCCQAPPHLPGKVTLCISLGNRQSCSEIREFEYRDKGSICAHCNKPRREATRSTEELLLLVRFVQMLLSNSSMQKGDSSDLEIDHLLSKLKSDEDSWGQIIEALLVGSGNSSDTTEWLLQQLLKDKLQQWLSSRSQREYDLECSLSRKEQGIIHMIAGLGYQWALNPILGSGVGINFRDINGWTALHWAARFGREKMVAALIASGASAGAVTDPRAQDPIGKTPASIAAARGYKGLAGYLSELALTSHLSSLTLEESELSKGSANVQAEITVNNISRDNVASSEEQLSLKHTLAAVRNAAQAAARIQAAFRAHSFRKRQQQEAVVAANSFDEYGLSLDEISAASKLVFRNLHDDNKAALSIQKNYRGWKGRKDFLSLRQKVVKIQAHVRGHQVRKKYICWAVGILDKVVLRWRRKGVGLRGYKPDSDVIDENEEYEDILKGFRKQKVDVALGEAVSSVLSMVDSPQARQQYQRMLDRYQEAKAELGVTTGDAASTSQGDITSINSDFGIISNMSSEDVFQLL